MPKRERTSKEAPAPKRAREATPDEPVEELTSSGEETLCTDHFISPASQTAIVPLTSDDIAGLVTLVANLPPDMQTTLVTRCSPLGLLAFYDHVSRQLLLDLLLHCTCPVVFARNKAYGSSATCFERGERWQHCVSCPALFESADKLLDDAELRRNIKTQLKLGRKSILIHHALRHLFLSNAPLSDAAKRFYKRVFPLLELHWMRFDLNLKSTREYFRQQYVMGEIASTLQPTPAPEPRAWPKDPQLAPRQSKSALDFFAMAQSLAKREKLEDVTLDDLIDCGEQYGLYSLEPLPYGVQGLHENLRTYQTAEKNYQETLPALIEQFDKDRNAYYQSVHAQKQYKEDFLKYTIATHYASAVSYYRVYETTWKCPKNTLSTLFNVFRDACFRMQEKAPNNSVLGRGLSIKLKGLSDERVFSTMSAEEATAMNCPLIRVESKAGHHTIPIPLLKLTYDDHDKCVYVYLRDSHARAGSNTISKDHSLVIHPNGSCTGTRRAATLLPFLGLWNRDFRRVSDTLGQLLGYCVFCQRQLSKRSSLERGSGDICAERFAVADAKKGLLTEDNDGIAQNVRLNPEGHKSSTDTGAAPDAGVSLRTTDGKQITVSSEFAQGASSVLKTMFEDLAGGPNVEVPVPLTSASVLRVEKYITGDYSVGTVAELVEDIKSCDFLGGKAEIASLLGASLASYFVGRLE